MSDLIDRKKLYNYLNDWAFGIAPDERHEGTERLIRQVRYETIQECMSAIEDLPSVELASNLHQTIKNDAIDLISRQDAINGIIHGFDWETVNGIETVAVLNQIISDLSNLPSAEAKIIHCKSGKER